MSILFMPHPIKLRNVQAVLAKLITTTLLCLGCIPHAKAEIPEKVSHEFAGQSFEALRDSAKGEACKITITQHAMDLCGLQSVARNARVDYRYQDRTPWNNCNSLGFWCIGQDHTFVIGWKAEGDEKRSSFTVVFVNRQAAEQFNKALSEWTDTTPADVRGPGWRQ